MGARLFERGRSDRAQPPPLESSHPRRRRDITVGFLDRLFGRDDGSDQYRRQGPVNYGRPAPQQPPVRSEDEIAVERYRYLLRTAPPETIEQVHEEAFAKLTPEQRRL